MPAVTAPELASIPTQNRRVLPHNLDAEMSVVGGILLHPRAFQQVADMMEPQDFYHPAQRAIYQAMIELDGRASRSTAHGRRADARVGHAPTSCGR